MWLDEHDGEGDGCMIGANEGEWEQQGCSWNGGDAVVAGGLDDDSDGDVLWIE